MGMERALEIEALVEEQRRFFNTGATLPLRVRRDYLRRLAKVIRTMEGDILDLAANVGIINKSGAWYAYEGEKIGQGRENAKAYLKQNKEFCDMIEAKVREHYFAHMEEGPVSEDEPLDISDL